MRMLKIFGVSRCPVSGDNTQPHLGQSRVVVKERGSQVTSTGGVQYRGPRMGGCKERGGWLPVLGGARLKETVAQVDWSPSFQHLLHFNYLNVASLPSLMGHPPSYTHTHTQLQSISSSPHWWQWHRMCWCICKSGLEENSGERSLP